MQVGHIYDVGHKLIDEVDVLLDEPPRRPARLADLHLDSLPYSWRLEQCGKPGGGAIRKAEKPVRVRGGRHLPLPTPPLTSAAAPSTRSQLGDRTFLVFLPSAF